jgi:uncharacterized membrane protein YphA (DoxX/SURF4 family)
MVLRIVLGLIFLGFGADKFLNFLSLPAFEGPAGEFMGAIMATGYLFSLIAITEIVAGVLLILNKWKGFAMLLASVMIVNILAFHLALDPGGLGLVAVMLGIILLLYFKNWYKFKYLF